jgi:hypothetical protein
MSNSNPVIFTLRYSVLQNNYKKIFNSMGRFEYEDYKAQLFSERRLKTHFHLFSTLTLPSVAAASRSAPDVDLGLYILVSTELPPEHRAALDELVSQYDFIRVVAVAPEMGAPHRECILEFLRGTGAETATYAHCRLDDDDAISDDFLQRLSRYIAPEFSGFGVSLCSGFLATYDEEANMVGLYEYNYPKCSIGLAAIGTFDRKQHNSPRDVINIYEMGSHTKLDRRVPVIIDSMQPAFLRAIHSEQDSMSSELKRLPAPASPEQVSSCFTLDIGVLPTLEQSQANKESVQQTIQQRSKLLLRSS